MSERQDKRRRYFEGTFPCLLKRLSAKNLRLSSHVTEVILLHFLGTISSRKNVINHFEKPLKLNELTMLTTTQNTLATRYLYIGGVRKLSQLTCCLTALSGNNSAGRKLISD